jgi:hypothetical protein
VRRLTSAPVLRSVTTALGTSLRPAGRALVAVVGPEADVVGADAARAVAWVVAEVAVRFCDDAADLDVAEVLGCGAAGRAAVVVVAASTVVAVDELVGSGLAVEDVVESARTMAAGASLPPPPLQAEAAKARTAPRAARRKRKDRCDC